MKKNLLTYLVPIVLVIGTAFGAGIVAGDTEDSDVTVGVEKVCPSIVIYHDETDPETNGEMVDPYQDVTITGKIEAPHQGKYIEDDLVYITWEYDGEEDIGEADGGGTVEIDISGYDWEERGEPDELWVSHEFSPDPFWRYGRDCTWDIKVEIKVDCDEYDWSNDGYTSGVKELLEVSADNGFAEDVEPGTQLNGDDFKNDAGEHPTITITSNANWELDFGDGTAKHEGYDGDEIDYTLDVEGGYEEETSGDPVDSYVMNIDYDVWVPHGHLDGTYSTAEEFGGTSVSHTLSNTET